MNYTIRRAESSDCEAMHRIFTGPQVVWGTLQLPYPSVEMWRKRLAEPPDGLIRLVACLESGELVGQLGLHLSLNKPRRRHAGGIGMAVRDDWQGKGVGTALLQAAIELADRWLDLTRLDLQVFVDNEPAIHLYEKSGFRIEGTLAKYAFRDGQYVDTYIMARLRGEPDQP